MLFGAISPDGQTEEDRLLASKLRQEVEEARNHANRVANESVWLTNIAALKGFDGIYFNSNLGTFQPLNQSVPYLNRSRIHVNKILPTIQNRQARLCKNPPKYDVRPESNSTEDKEASRVALQTLSALWERLNLNEKRLNLYMALQQCGHAYMKITWDPTLGNLMPDLDGTGPAYEGDVSAEVVSAFEIFPDPLAKSFEEVLRSHLYQARVRPLAYFRAQYPEKGEMVKAEDAWLLSAMYEQRANSMNPRGPVQGGSGDQMKNSAIELVKYEAPSKENPQGQMIVSANGVLLHKGPLPCGEIPFAKFDDIIVSGSYYPESVITHLRPISEAKNELIRRRSDWVRSYVAGKYSVARGADIGEESLHNGASEVLEHNVVPNDPNGGRPVPITVPALPQWTFTEEDRLDVMFNDISGVQEIDKGRTESASIPAIGMQLMTENSDTRIGVMTEQHEHAFARVGRLILKYVEKNYTLPRKLKIAGPNLAYAVKEVSGEMLKGNTDAYVVRGSTLPGSKTLKRQDILNSWQMGLLGDPADPKVREKVLNLIEFGDIQGLWEDLSLDQAQVKKVIDSLEAGIPVDVSEFDNHTWWLIELNRYRKSDKFQALDPMRQALLLETMEMCMQAMMQVDPNVVAAEQQAQMMDEAASAEQALLEQETGGAPMDQVAPTQPLEEEVVA